MKKWSKRKAQVSLFAVLFAFFMLSSFLNNESGETSSTEVSTSRPSFPTHSTLNTSKNPTPDASEWSRACASPSKYVGKSTTAAAAGERPRRRQVQGGCDLFGGRWVYDESGAYPLYDEASCPYMSDQLACGKHGRLDKGYQRWRWQPHGCHLKRWNATEMLEKLRGKRLMFVGDSLNRGQWISMVCLVQSVIPNGKKSMSPNAALTIFRAEEYNATIEFYWAPLIVESNSDDPVNHRLDDRIIRPEAIRKHAHHWKDADILVFNSYLWWRSGSKIKMLTEHVNGRVCEEASGRDAMEFALQTWADWVDAALNPPQRRAFFVTMSPTHLWSWEWSPEKREGNCYEEVNPIREEGYWGTGSDLDTMRMVEKIISSKLQGKVTVLNITQLSEYRKDGHPSIHRKFWETFSPQELANPVSYADCVHWCLPGVPDVWNELLFNSL